MAASIEELSYEMTAGALAEQERALNALRTRAGTIVAAASISGSFLGAKVSHGSADVWGVLALIAFVMCLGCNGDEHPKATSPKPPAQLPATAPPGFALPEKRGGLFGTKK